MCRPNSLIEGLLFPRGPRKETSTTRTLGSRVVRGPRSLVIEVCATYCKTLQDEDQVPIGGVQVKVEDASSPLWLGFSSQCSLTNSGFSVYSNRLWTVPGLNWGLPDSLVSDYSMFCHVIYISNFRIRILRLMDSTLESKG